MNPVLVAGGGLAGAAAAAELARAGVAVTLVERETQPVHKICGEFLSSEAQAYLSRLGLDVSGFGGAPISRLRLIAAKRKVEVALPFQGIGLSRRKLDEALLQHAERSGACVLRGRTIRGLHAGSDLALEVEGEPRMPAQLLAAQRLLLATGKHELRGAKRQADTKYDLIGFKMHFRLNPAAQAMLAGHIELIFFAGGYAGLQMIEDGVANLCLLAQRKKFAQCGSSWLGLLEGLQQASPHLAEALRDAEPLLPQPLSIYRVPYGYLHRPRHDDPPLLFRLGDQACVIHSFTGDGMAIALHSAALAVRAVLQGDDAATYHRRLVGDVGGQIRRADALYALLNAPVSQPLVFALARLWPASLQMAAAATRVPLRARL